jgi:protein TonB
MGLSSASFFLCYRSAMPKSWRFPCFCWTLALLTPPAIHSQETSVQSTPSDPKQLMVTASKSNNLTSGDLQPWHLKATFALIDADGKTTDQGTFEEFWAGPNKSKEVCSGPNSSRVDFRTADGLFRSSTPGDPPVVALEVRREFLQPLPTLEDIEHETYELEQRNAGTTKLSCLKVTGLPANPGLNYCLAEDKPLLRLSVLGFESLQVLHNRILNFKGHYVPGDLQFVRSGKTIGTAHLETIESLDPVNDALFAPTPDAKLVPRRIQISAGVAAGMLKKHPTPEYPPQAGNAGISGLVVLQITIGTDGRVNEAHVVNGPAVFQQVALDAVRNWVYQPYLLNGQAVEVTTTVNVVFSLQNRIPVVKPAALQ